MKKKKTNRNLRSHAAPGRFQKPKEPRELSGSIPTGLEVQISKSAHEKIPIKVKKPFRLTNKRELEISLDGVRRFIRAFADFNPLGQYIVGYFKRGNDVQNYPDSIHLIDVKFLGEIIATAGKPHRKFYLSNKGRVFVVEMVPNADGTPGRSITCMEYKNDLWTNLITEDDAKKMLHTITVWIRYSLSVREQDIYHLKCHPLYDGKKK